MRISDWSSDVCSSDLRRQIPVPDVRRPLTKGRDLTVHGATEHNLQDVDVSFPLGVFCAVTGVSGSGKSTLANDILYTSLAKQIYNARTVPGRHRRITGIENVDKVDRKSTRLHSSH